MRVCGACFYGWFETPSDREGACHNRPPHVFLVATADGEATFMSQRPVVARQDMGCFFFSHKNKKPADEA